MENGTPSGNGTCGEKRIWEVAALDKSNIEVDFGDLIWFQLDHHWWLGQVVDEKTVGPNKRPRKKLAGEVLVRLYGSYTYLYVDPVKSQSEYEQIIKKYQGSPIYILEEALKQDLLHLESDGMKIVNIKSKGMLRPAASRRTNRKNKSHDTKTLASKIALAAESTPRRRLKVMQALGLMAPVGSPFHPRSRQEAINQMQNLSKE